MWTHLSGVGPASTLSWFRAIFRRFAAIEYAAGRPAPLDLRLSLLFEALQASMAKSNQHAIRRLTSSSAATDPPAPPCTWPPRTFSS